MCDGTFAHSDGNFFQASGRVPAIVPPVEYPAHVTVMFGPIGDGEAARTAARDRAAPSLTKGSFGVSVLADTNF